MPAANLRVVPRAPEQRALLFVLCLIILLAVGCSSRKSSLQTLDGHLLDTAGKVLVVNFWAEWCAPCREEIPELNAFYRAHKERVLVVGINFDQLPPQQVREQARKFGIDFPLLAAAPVGRWGQAVPQVLPSTFIIDQSGQWRQTLVGPQTEASLAEAIAATLRQ